MPTRQPSRVRCPNCGRSRRTPEDACVLEAIGSVLIHRGYGKAEIMRLLGTLDPDVFWAPIGKIVDNLEELVAAQRKQKQKH
jgi:hypothetical protein